MIRVTRLFAQPGHVVRREEVEPVRMPAFQCVRNDGPGSLYGRVGAGFDAAFSGLHRQ